MGESILSKVIVELQVKARDFSRVIGNARKNLRAFKGVTGATNDSFRNLTTESGLFNQNMEVMQTVGGRAAAKFRLFTRGMKGFKMEMLGIMFFGMAMQKMFSNMLKPAAKMFGIFELWGTTMAVFFLPIMEELFPLFLGLMEAFMEAPDWVKKLVGGLVILGAVLGTILFTVGMMSLGLGALAAVSAGMIVTFGIVVLAIIAIIAVIVAVIIVVRRWGDISDWVAEKWKGAILAIGDWFKGMLNDVTGWLEDMINGMIRKLNKVIKALNKIKPGKDIPTIGPVDFATDFKSSAELAGIGVVGGDIGFRTPGTTIINNIFNGYTTDDLIRTVDDVVDKQVDKTVAKVGPYAQGE